MHLTFANVLFSLSAILLLGGVIYGLVVGPNQVIKNIPRTIILSYLGIMIVCLSVSIPLLVEEQQKIEPVFVENAHVWNNLPLNVRSRIDNVYSNPIEGAIDLWNREIGCKVFRRVGTNTVIRVDVILEDYDGMPCENPGSYALEKDMAAGTWICPDNHAEIAFQTLDEISMAYKIISHELGHVLGLAHDPGGLMGDNITNLTFVFPSDKDKKALHERYCH